MYLCVFVWISEQTAIIYQYRVNLLVLEPKHKVFTVRYELGL